MGEFNGKFGSVVLLIVIIIAAFTFTNLQAAIHADNKFNDKNKDYSTTHVVSDS